MGVYVFLFEDTVLFDDLIMKRTIRTQMKILQSVFVNHLLNFTANSVEVKNKQTKLFNPGLLFRILLIEMAITTFNFKLTCDMWLTASHSLRHVDADSLLKASRWCV